MDPRGEPQTERFEFPTRKKLRSWGGRKGILGARRAYFFIKGKGGRSGFRET